MREDWDRRAREDALYYVAFGRRRQTAEEFFATAADVLRAIRSEFGRFPPGADFPKMAALEIGCGPGRLMVPLSREFGHIAGVDVSKEMIELARRNLHDSPNAHVEVASGADLAGFDDESFDLCYSYAVFQHIPSREVVLGYLHEARRVLKTGGLLKCQFNGMRRASRQQADTWNGVSFDAAEIREFCSQNDFQLFSLEGENTPEMWIAARKRAAGWSRGVQTAAGPAFRELGNALTTDRLVPVSGRFSCASLQVENLAADADINNTAVEIAGRPVAPCYISEYSRASYSRDPITQVNVFLPPGTPTGLLPVRLLMLGQPITGFGRLRVILAPPRAPRLLRVSDGINLVAESRIETRSIQADIEEAGPAPEIGVDIDGTPLNAAEVELLDARLERYSIRVKLPDRIAAGPHWLNVRLHGRLLAPALLEVADMLHPDGPMADVMPGQRLPE